ncbi:MAG: T9SS type A sorting domain-containing protein, partial [Gemmatimonadetes bacterium]|nr:T9SS type A sorting domain-containing protein [Gemmatimonadota bacterium]
TFTFTQTGAVGVSEGLPRHDEALVALGPNPLRESTRFQIRVPSGRSADLAVYGVSGQRVRSLVRGESGADRVVSWNGRDDSGALVPSGVYYVALQTDGEAGRTHKVVVTR